MPSQSTHHGIIVGVDGSPASEQAVDWAARDAHLRNIPLTLVHVLPTIEAAMWLDVPVSEEWLQARDRRSTEILTEAARIANLATHDEVTVETLAVSGNAVATLADLSKDATMVVVGCRGLGAISGRLLGSVSTGLVHHGHCPIAVFHDEERATGPVVVGIDGSPTSESAVAIAFDEASRRGVPLVAVHTYSDAVADAGFAYANWTMVVEQAEEALAERVARALPRCDGAAGGHPRLARESVAGAVEGRPVAGGGQPRSRRFRRVAAGLGEFGCRARGTGAGDHRAVGITPRAASVRRGDRQHGIGELGPADDQIG